MDTEDLFTLRPAADYRIYKLITGVPVRTRYYDTRLERIKKLVKKEPFCSLIDYTGGAGPVKVTNDNEFNELQF